MARRTHVHSASTHSRQLGTGVFILGIQHPAPRIGIAATSTRVSTSRRLPCKRVSFVPSTARASTTLRSGNTVNGVPMCSSLHGGPIQLPAEGYSARLRTSLDERYDALAANIPRAGSECAFTSTHSSSRRTSRRLGASGRLSPTNG